jgi:hypothetical protein
MFSTSRSGQSGGDVGRVYRPSALPSIAGTMLQCRELAVRANSRLLHPQRTALLFDDLVGAHE